MTLRIDEELVEWMYANIPRPLSVSDYVNEAIREKVSREKGRGKK